MLFRSCHPHLSPSYYYCLATDKSTPYNFTLPTVPSVWLKRTADWVSHTSNMKILGIIRFLVASDIFLYWEMKIVLLDPLSMLKRLCSGKHFRVSVTLFCFSYASVMSFEAIEEHYPFKYKTWSFSKEKLICHGVLVATGRLFAKNHLVLEFRKDILFFG